MKQTDIDRIAAAVENEMSDYTITGSDAIAYANAKGVTLSKYADSTEAERGWSMFEHALKLWQLKNRYAPKAMP